jgi:aryl-alcohol dehydrogenase-like predicted oxidoreductase
MTSAQPVLASGTFDLGGELAVRRLGYGAMQITGPGVWGEPADRDACIAVLRRAVELGVDFIDTADSYGPFVSEDLIREALHPYGHVRIATKAGFTRQGPGVWRVVGHPDYLRQCAEMSLRRLGVETIDLYQLHRIDSHVPLADQLGVFADLVQEGKVRHVGLSEVSVEDLVAAQEILPIASVQNPIATGQLTAPDGPLTAISERTGLSSAQLALAWLLRRSPVMLPIPGTKTLSHLEDNCSAGEVELDDATYAELDALAAP